MKQLLVIVLFGFLVFIYPAQQLNQFEYPTTDNPTITEFVYLPDAKIIPQSISILIEKQKIVGPSVPYITADKLVIYSLFLTRKLPSIEIHPDAHGFLNVVAFQSSYFSDLRF
ncbi:hypothetical protein [Pseudalkalibacillus hwajinpoensis]|uniref:hypothetical protein n=1 Tax=Guptibacillus hwajinpoensis TaxID=208199 RepID=UPI00146B866F|nr:hypothetical protein [Pseudalkalibacillus hwajinpoensis]